MRRLIEGLAARSGPWLRPFLEAASRRGQGRLERRLPLDGLAAPATAHIDEYGVPHVRAATDADVFRVQGFLHARDRFFQMDMLRRVLRGRLSEIVGERALGAAALPPFGLGGTTLDADRLVRALDLVGAARGVWAGAAGDGRALLAAYAEGVNAGVRRLRRHKPLEHRLLRLVPEPWHPVDSILIAKGMALGLSFKWRAAPLFTAIAEHLAERPEHLEALLPKVPGKDALAITDCVRGGVAAGIEGALRFFPQDAPTVGSNAWLVGSARTKSGAPLLASDPHLELSLPSIWYLASLYGRTYRAVGASLPGLPGVVIGRTPSVAWGLTNGMLDDADLWIEELDETGRRYRLDGAWRDLEIDEQSVPRRGKRDATFTLRRTHRGPLISDAFPGYEGPPLSLRMTLHEATHDLEAFLGLGRARTVGEALRSARGFGSPAQNLLVADTEGRAAYRLLGHVPQRGPAGHPVFARDGRTTATDWTGYVPEGDLPGCEVGPEDQLVSSNHPQVGAAYPHYLSHLYEPDYRAQRIGARLAGARDLTAADMRALQMDAVNLAPARLRKAVLEPHAAEIRRLRPTLGPLLERLLAFDGDERRGACGAATWHLAYHHLIQRVFEPVLGARLTMRWMGLMNLVDDALLGAFEASESPWLPTGERVRLVLAALEDTARDLQAHGLGLDAPWGAFHALHLRHPAGGLAPLAATFNRGPLPADGGPFTVSAGQYLHSRPGPMVVGPSYRQVVDLAAPEAARMITFGGQSGHVGSPHYDDLTARWQRGETLPMHLEALPENARIFEFVPR